MARWYGLLMFYAVSLATLIHHASSSEIVNPHPFTHLHNNENICTDDTELLIWIHTAPGNIRNRLLIRQTWGNPWNHRDYKTALVFFLGATRDSKTQSLISYESQQYGDIVQGSFVDSYRNLTYKAIHGAKWTSTYCRSAKLVLKADDDIMADIYQLARHLRSLQSHGLALNNSLVCSVWKGRAPQRGVSKWQVKEEEFAANVYPTYCPGLALVMNADVVPRLYNASLYENFFWIDDIYLTGILAKRIKASFVNIGSTIHFGPSPLIKGQTYAKSGIKWIFFHSRTDWLKRTLWEMIVAQNNDGIT